MSFLKFLEKSEAAAISTDQLEDELERRRLGAHLFPLDVFHPKIKPFITEMHSKHDIPRSYVGLGLLMAYSTAIGTAYVVCRNARDRMGLSLWGCFTGMSSSGKSTALNMCMDPLYKIQTEFDKEWNNEQKGKNEEQRLDSNMKMVVYRDAHVPTLIRTAMPANPKGMLKNVDEILEWINGMNSLSKKEGTDEQFWLSSWNGTGYSAIRANNVKISIPRVFVNVIGGIQWPLVHKLFKNDRGQSGFIFRILFANAEDMVSHPITGYSMPDEYFDFHEWHIQRLYNDLRIEKDEDEYYKEPKRCILSEQANSRIDQWATKKIRTINAMTDSYEKNIHAGIFGKMKEYSYRFAALLAVSDRCYNFNTADPTNNYFPDVLHITESLMERALRLTEYFYESAAEIYSYVDNTMNAPLEIIQMANMFKSGQSVSQMADRLLGNKSKKSRMHRMLNKAKREYPKLFGVENI